MSAAIRAQMPADFPGMPQIRNEEPADRYLARINAGLDKLNAELGPEIAKPRHNLVFSANMNFAHAAYVRHTPLDVLLAWADALKEAGATRIDLNPGLGPWLQHDEETLAKYEALVRHIHDIGLEVAWNVTTFTRDLKVASFEEWAKTALPIYGEMAGRYKPDIFIPVHEPTTLSFWMGVKTTPEAWEGFVAKAIRTIKQASPNTRVGAGVYESERAYFDRFVALPGLDVLTIDIYFLDRLTVFERMAASARKAGKDIYIEETWRFPQRKIDGKVLRDPGNRIYENLDIKWFTAMVRFADKYGIGGITPFHSAAIFAYFPESLDTSDPRYFRGTIAAVKNGERTRFFHVYRELSREYGRGTMR